MVINPKPNTQLQADFLRLVKKAFYRAFSPNDFSGLISLGGSEF